MVPPRDSCPVSLTGFVVKVVVFLIRENLSPRDQCLSVVKHFFVFFVSFVVIILQFTIYSAPWIA
jgi:hypothetical protein